MITQLPKLSIENRAGSEYDQLITKLDRSIEVTDEYKVGLTNLTTCNTWMVYLAWYPKQLDLAP